MDKHITRRRAIALTAGTLAAPFVARNAFAQEDFPAREIKVVCAYPPGSGADTLARYYAEGMKPFLSKPVIVENRAGANGNLAAGYLARAKPDGYTVMIHAPSGIAANVSLYKEIGFDPKQLEVVATVSKLAFTVAVRNDAPWKTLGELLAYLQAKGDKASYATTAPTGQVAGAMMIAMKGLKTVEVPYRSGIDAVNDLAGGNIDFAMYDPTFALAQQRAGRVRLLAIGSKDRMTSMPDVPTMKEQGVGDIDVVGWWGLMAPMGVPAPVKKKLEDAFVAMGSAPATREFLVKAGTDPFALRNAEAQKYYLEEIENWRKYTKIAKIEPRG